MKSLRKRVDDLIEKGYGKDDAIDRAYENAQNCMYDSRVRMDKRIDKIIQSDRGMFFTLTLNGDQNINDVEFYKRKAKEWSRKHLTSFIGNEDYGKKRGRLHFHVVGIPNELEYARSWKYGNLNWKYVRLSSNPKKIRNYILKLTNHAMKSTAETIFKSKKI